MMRETPVVYMSPPSTSHAGHGSFFPPPVNINSPPGPILYFTWLHRFGYIFPPQLKVVDYRVLSDGPNAESKCILQGFGCTNCNKQASVCGSALDQMPGTLLLTSK
ncbi:hypothetical protein TWF225_002011 [Orbilia oligospora]|uniref:Uncharacterized protein n=1 Tax=Orbilia oligospora TaxID=2813651 RepID=A0A7C8KDE9_ORBOL|nr:hypothetical protein TWF225_002011 [Orbilia oligospora]KAF3172188.1 hypothetical protein TWF751_005847 [Orbilia oligospora]KAF3252814.1 hypothetical protein TWF128_006699 [Orbilia oligospora]KAF3252911.1 hypothetical protein TWF217_007648 [Orbilia oligospora]KAF3288004.1 hypothetical protein TWF132_008120 [Orbilia oligospora]